MANEKEVIITKVNNGFLISVYNENELTQYVATSVRESYSFGSTSITSVLDSIFNPQLESGE